MNKFKVNLKVAVTLTVQAEDRVHAELLAREELWGDVEYFGEWPDGSPIVAGTVPDWSTLEVQPS